MILSSTGLVQSMTNVWLFFLPLPAGAAAFFVGATMTAQPSSPFARLPHHNKPPVNVTEIPLTHPEAPGSARFTAPTVCWSGGPLAQWGTTGGRP